MKPKQRCLKTPDLVTGVMQPQVKGGWQPQKAGRGKEWVLS